MSATLGKWSAPTTTPGGVFVIHAILLHTGNVLLFSGHVENANYPPESWVWDPTRPAGTAVKFPFPAASDIFCCHHVVLEDGKVLTAGGAGRHPNHGTGITDICIFDPENPVWKKIGDMSEARWYPTLVTLPDGRLVVFSGHLDQDPAAPPGQPRNFRTTAGTATTVELFGLPFRGPNYTPQTIALTPVVFHIYPGFHLVKGGEIFYTGTTWRYEAILMPPALQPLLDRTDPTRTPIPPGNPIGTFSFRVTGATGTWAAKGVSPGVNLREEGTSVLLPPAQDGKILLLGGCRAIGHLNFFVGLAPGSDPRSAEILNTQVSPPTWTPAGPSGQMNFPRINASAVLLPDGTVFIVGGHSQHKWAPTSAPSVSMGLPPDPTDPDRDVDDFSRRMSFTNPHHPRFTTPRFSGQSTFSLTPEIYDPVANTFTPMADMKHPRTYHSACLLLPDGRVLCAGGVNPNNPETVTPPPMPTDPNPQSMTIPENQKTMEIYEPTYFFKVRRPTITRFLSQGGPNIHYGGEFEVVTPDAANIAQVVLMRPGAMTHHTDTEQRLVTLTFTKETGKLKVQVLNDPTVLPPGFYMLWIVDNSRLPCQQAVFVRVSQRQARPSITRCDFPRREVETLVAGGGVARFDNAFEVDLMGFLPDELGITTATPTPAQLAAIAPTITFTAGDGTTVPGLSATPQEMLLEDSTLPADKRQQVTFPYAVEFDGLTAFLEAGSTKAIANQVIRLTASKGDFTGAGEITLFDDFFQRVLVTLRRTTGNQFVSTKEVQLIGTCDHREETDSTVFVSGIPGGSLRAQLAAMSDEVDVEA